MRLSAVEVEEGGQELEPQCAPTAGSAKSEDCDDDDHDWLIGKLAQTKLVTSPC